MKWRIHAVAVLCICSLLIILVPFFNGLGCDYEMEIHWQDNDYNAVCRWGVINVVETDQKTHARWLVEARQFSFANQIIYLVSARTQLNKGDQPSELNVYNQVQHGFHIYNYAWRSLNQKRVLLFQVSPHREAYIARLEGTIDIADELFNHRRMYRWNKY